MPDDIGVRGTGAREVAGEAHLHVVRSEAVQAELRQHCGVSEERVHEELEGAHHSPDRCADHDNQLVIFEAPVGFPAQPGLLLQDRQDARGENREEPVIPNSCFTFPGGGGSILDPLARPTQEVPKLYQDEHGAWYHMWLTSVRLPSALLARRREDASRGSGVRGSSTWPRGHRSVWSPSHDTLH